MRLNWGKTFIIGFGFMAISAVWPLYDSYMPKFYGEMIASSALVGLIMGFDNVLGLTLQPWFGALSDRTRSKWGRRRPFLLIGMPIAAVMVLAIPFARLGGLVPLLLVTIVMNLAMSLFRSPTVALMPDLTPSPLRSLANGVINFMGGLGAAIVLLAGGILYAMSPAYPFMVSAAIMGGVFLLFLFFIREPAAPDPANNVEETPQSLLLALRQIITNPDRGVLILFLAIMAWFVGYQSVNTWFTTYSEQNLGVAVNVASKSLTLYAGAFLLGALPAGVIGTKFGRRNTIAVGLIGMMASFASMHMMTSLSQVQYVLVVAGLCWALININSYPMVVEMCHPSQTGTYTGLYYIFSGVAGAGGPFLTGAIFDLFGSKRPLFLVAAIFMALALALILAQRKGEAAPEARAPGVA